MDLTIAVHFLESSDQQIVRRQLRDYFNVLDMPTNQFIANFRVSKEIFTMILTVMEGKCNVGFRGTKLRPDIKLATFLRFLATGSYQRTVGNENVSSTSKVSVYRIIDECLHLFEDFICPQWIQMPDPEEERKIMEGFFNRFGFPGIIGCVDGTHIRIKSPGHSTKRLYYNRKGYYSINAMMICDHDMIIRYVDARYPGSNHDAFIWEYSGVNQRLENSFSNGKRNAWILGDGGYKLKPFLMTPYRNPVNRNETRYNRKHSSARNMVERCFGLLKNRFRCIICSRGLHYSPEKATKIINACCALHNMCIKLKCGGEINEIRDTGADINGTDENDDGEEIAAAIRRNIALNL